MKSIDIAVESDLDETIIKKIIESVDGKPNVVYGKNGKKEIRKNLQAFNEAAKRTPWIVLVDLDEGENGDDCVYNYCRSWLPIPSPKMCFRAAVHESEAWLLADREKMSIFLGISKTSISLTPELLPYPKEYLINLARGSRFQKIKDDIIPLMNSGRVVGRAYNSRMIEYVNRYWRIEKARENSESLERCIKCLERILN
jgi:hypothetical protein